MNNFYKTIYINTTVDKVYNALTRQISLWWTVMFTGNADHQDCSFTLRFGKNVFKTMQVKQLSPARKVVWVVTDALLNIPELKNKKEWIDTIIIWEIAPQINGSKLQLTHQGLHPAVECYTICADGWRQFLSSLQQFLETGKGNPYQTSN
ncbi:MULTISPECIES: SRPBCC family protein [Sphingobacterium]|uniref:SRPBCC family protein n=1 Tax=Sphingobacterium TaxID=28453 RepID=UPI0013DBEF96|nr:MULTISPECIES: SRPBCC domain-containing protein [unclassified Sphingobacterium]